jgi:hypothetical protein
MYYRQREPDRYRGIDGVSSSLEDLQAGLRRKFMNTGDHGVPGAFGLADHRPLRFQLEAALGNLLSEDRRPK